MDVRVENPRTSFFDDKFGKPVIKFPPRDNFCDEKNDDISESSGKRLKQVDVGFGTPVKDLKRHFETFQLAAQKVSCV